MIKMLKFAGIPVRDQDVALEFYTQKLGFLVVTDKPMGPGQRWIEIKPPRGETGLALFTPEGHEKRIGEFQGLSFKCDDVEKTYEELRAAGVEFESPPQKQPWGSYCIFKDPDGNKFVLGS
ncbi:MAG: VOC family protein [Phycisphaerales bacterium]|nr:VOC family protein [Phycisphaerales bacterium]